MEVEHLHECIILKCLLIEQLQTIFKGKSVFLLWKGRLVGVQTHTEVEFISMKSSGQIIHILDSTDKGGKAVSEGYWHLTLILPRLLQERDK